VIARKTNALSFSLGFALSVIPTLSYAQSAVIDYLPPIGSTPLSAYGLIESNIGAVHVYAAERIEIPETSRTLLSLTPQALTPMPEFGVAFITDPLRESPAVARWSADSYLINAMSTQALSRDILELDAQTEKERITSVDLQDRAREIEESLAFALNLSELRDRLEEKRELERAIAEKQLEIARLEQLIEIGRQVPAPSEADQMRAALSVHLRETAQVTATADHLTRRRLEAAQNRVKAKIRLIEQLKVAQPDQLARELMTLRGKRRELEVRLGKAPTAQDEANQF
jgi:hypothetical protein